MENFFVDDKFYSDFNEFLIDIEVEEDEINELDEDWTQEIELTTLEPILKIDEKYLNNIVEEITDWEVERFPEDGDKVIDKIKEAFIKSFDQNKLNELMPKLYYPNGKKVTLTKKDLLDYI